MPTDAEHLAQYQHNHTLLYANGGLWRASPSWAAVVAFYAALHLVERLAALDIAGKAFGAPVAAALQADNAYLDQMLKRADAISAIKLVSHEDVGRDGRIRVADVRGRVDVVDRCRQVVRHYNE